MPQMLGFQRKRHARYALQFQCRVRMRQSDAQSGNTRQRGASAAGKLRVLSSQVMNNEEHDDFAAKLLQIEEQANMALNDLPAGLTRDRVQHIAIVARMLRYRLDVAAIVVLPSPDSSRRSPS